MNRKYVRLAIVGFVALGGLLLFSTVAGLSKAGAAAPKEPLKAGSEPGPLILSCSTTSFGGATNFAVGTGVAAGPWSMAAGGFNRDGNGDLVTGNNSTAPVSVRLGNS